MTGLSVNSMNYEVCGIGRLWPGLLGETEKNRVISQSE